MLIYLKLHIVSMSHGGVKSAEGEKAIGSPATPLRTPTPRETMPKEDETKGDKWYNRPQIRLPNFRQRIMQFGKMEMPFIQNSG
jgi:hypothetical protein